MEGLEAALQVVLAARAKLEAQLAGLERRAAAARERWMELDEAAPAAPPGPLPEMLKLNIGGDSDFAVSRATILHTSSRLAQMFSGRWDHILPRDSNERFFLDLDSVQMRAIFKWLTELTKVGPGGPPPLHPRDQLPDEHKWGIDELMQHLCFTKSDAHGEGTCDTPPYIASGVDSDDESSPASQDGPGILGAADDHGISAAARELGEMVASYALQVDRAEREVQARRAAMDEERAFVEGYAAAFRTEGAIVPLNVSGVAMLTARATLLQEEASMLAAKFGPAWRLQDEEFVDGAVFLDADPAAFALLLQDLRLRRLGVPTLGPLPLQAAGGALLPRLLDYYGITGMKRRRLVESAIMTHEQELQVAAWLPQGTRAELLFRASRDGFGSAAFHARCDNRGATLVVALSAGGHRFGGFADAPWTSPASHMYSRCTGSFLFRLRGLHEEPPARCALKPNCAQYGICCCITIGPTFGGGNDLRVQSGSGSCRCKFNDLGNTYELPAGGARTLAEALPASSKASPGRATSAPEADEVTVTEYEVFRIF